MKILTNIQCGSLEELARHTFAISWRDYLAKKGRDVQFVAADVWRADGLGAAGGARVMFEDRYFKLVVAGARYGYLADILKSAASLDSFKESLMPVIDKYRSIIKNERPDVVLVNCTYYLPWCLYVAAKMEGIRKIVIHYHGIMKKEIEDYDENAKKILCAMESDFHSDNDLAIFPSLFAKETVEKEVVNKKMEKWAVVPNAVPDHFFRFPPKAQGKGENIGAVIRWSKIKNPEFLQRLAEYRAKNGKNFKINVVSKPLREDDVLYSRMKEGIDFIDPLPNEDLAEFYSRMDLIVCPSHFETYGNVAQEALASGTPALVGPSMGIADLYREIGIGDWIIDFGDFKTAADAVERASFEVVAQSVRDELRERLNTEKVFDGLFAAITNG